MIIGSTYDYVITKLLSFHIPGGLTAVMYTDTAQSIIIVIGAFVVMGLSKLHSDLLF